MDKATKALPEGYVQSGKINLKNNLPLAITLNIAAIIVAVLSFFLLYGFATLFRPGVMISSGVITLGGMAVLAGSVVLLFTLHELVHGLFFWVVTRSRPAFALRLFYAYTAAPDWYIPVRQFLIIALGPLVIIGAAGMMLMLLVPESWLLSIAIMAAVNTGGSLGDLLVLTRLRSLSSRGFANDTGDEVSFYDRPPAIGHP